MPIFLQAVPAAYGKLEVRYRNVQHLTDPVAFFLGVFVVILAVRGLGVFEVEQRPRVVGIHVQNAAVALRGLVVLIAVFVKHAEVYERPDVRGKPADRPVVILQGDIVVAVAIVFQGQAKQGAGMVAIDLYRSFIERDDFLGIAAQRRDGGRPLS